MPRTKAGGLRNLLPILIGVILQCVAFTSGSGAYAQGTIVLSPAEKKWIAANPVVKLAADHDYAPINFTVNGKLQGMAVDLLNLIENKTGLTFELRTGPWSELIDAALAHEVDAIVNADVTAERQKRLLFTEVYYQAPQAIVVRSGRTDVQDLDDLAGKTVALLSGTSHIDYFRQSHPDISVFVADTSLASFDALLTGDADAIVSSLPVINYIMESRLLSAFQIVGIFDTDSLDNLRIAVRNTAPPLRTILNKGIASITAADMARINRKWLPPSTFVLLESSEAPGVNLTPEEVAWLKRHPVIRVAADRSWPPIEFLNETRTFEGISVDYLNAIGEMLGVRFVFDPGVSWAEAVEKLKNRELDMFSAAAKTPSRVEFATFTAPYLDLPQVLFSRLDAPFIPGIEALDGERVAVVRGYAIGELIRSDYPKIEIVEVDDIAAGIDAVRAGRAFAFVGGIMSVGYELRQSATIDMKVAGQTPYVLQIAMAARSDWPIFHSVLQKALRSIPESTRKEIESNWASIKVDVPPDYTLVMLIASVVVILFLLLWTWQMVMQRRRLYAIQEEMVSARYEAEIANNAKSEFLASMSHELRTPLNAIIGFAQFMKLDPDARRTSKQDEYLDNIIAGGNHLAELVNQVLDLSKIEAGEFDIVAVPCDVREIIEECVDLVRPLARQKNVEISADGADGHEFMVMADRLRLRQALINLLSNAIVYNQDGGTVRVDKGIGAAGFIRISVTDTGVGIDPTVQDKIFDLFFTNRPHAMIASEGTGIGLSVSRKLIELMGGRIDFKSITDQGSTFWIDLPAVNEEQEAAPEAYY